MTSGIGTASTFWLFGLCSLVGLAFVYRFVPETKGRTLEAIETDLRENVSLAD